MTLAIGIGIFCVANPLGGPKVDLSEPSHLLGGFVSRTNWALVLIGTLLTVGGVGEGWFTELFLGGYYDAELEKTHAYALFILLLPGLLPLWYNLIPFFKRGTEFGSSLTVRSRSRQRGAWPASLEYEYVCVDADGFDVDEASSSDHFAAKRLP